MAAHTLGTFLSLDAFIKSSEQEIQIDSSRRRNMRTTVDVDLYLAWFLSIPTEKYSIPARLNSDQSQALCGVNSCSGNP
jgi:hypothetical protein